MLKAVIFDLDGVILSTDSYHYRAWKMLADREQIYFDETINERLRGVSRMESLEIILERATRQYSNHEKEEMADLKNEAYKELLQNLTPDDVFPGVREFLAELKKREIKVGIGSSSKNTKFILQKTGLDNIFSGAVSDGTNITKSKPDPEVFLKAAAMMSVQPRHCMVVEDADAGVIAAKAAKMTVIGVGPAAAHQLTDIAAVNIAAIDINRLRLVS